MRLHVFQRQLRPMKAQRLKAAGIVLAVVAAFLSLGAAASAHSFRSGDNTTLQGGETVDSSLFVASKTVNIAGTVKGDVFCTGQNVAISGTVNGDVLCAGQTVSITGTVHGNIRAAGQTVTVGGPVDRNVSLAGQSLTIANGAKVGGDASLAGQTVAVNGGVARDVAAAGSDVTIDSSIGRNIQANVEHLSLGSSAKVSGTIEYSSFNTLKRDRSAQVSGKVTRTEPRHPAERKHGSPWLAGLVAVIAALTFAMVLVLFIPQVFHRTTGRAQGHLGKTFLTGLVASIVGPVIVVGLIFTVIGLPLAIVFLLAWLVLLALAGPFAAYLLGRYIVRNSNALWVMLAGAAVLIVLYLIPIVGQVAMLVALWFGLGMVLRELARVPYFHYDMSQLDPAGNPPARPRHAAKPAEDASNE